MIIVINSKGGLVSQQVEDLFQGSSKANVINVIAPFATNVVVRASFEMPDGSLFPKDKAGYILNSSIKIADNLNTWSLPIDFPITQNYGIVSMQLRMELGGEILATTTVKFPIQKGVPYGSEYIEKGTYEEILQLISDLRGLLDDKLEKVNYNYILAEVNSETVGVYYTYDEKTKKYQAVVLPQGYKENVSYFKELSKSAISYRENEFILSFEQNGKKAELKLADGKILSNNEEIATINNLIAENIKYQSIIEGSSVKNVKEALDELDITVDKLKQLLVYNLGERTISTGLWVKNSENEYIANFTDELLKDPLTQTLIITPNDDAIDKLNEKGILLYPSIDIEISENGNAVAKLKASEKPDFDIVADFKIQGVNTTEETQGINASYIRFSPTESIDASNVQRAIEKVNENIGKEIKNNEEALLISVEEKINIESAKLNDELDNELNNKFEEYYQSNLKTIEFAESERLKSANIFKPINNKPGDSATKLGITLTVNDDYTFTLNGKINEGQANFPLFANITETFQGLQDYYNFELDKNKEYTYMLKVLGGSVISSSSQIVRFSISKPSFIGSVSAILSIDRVDQTQVSLLKSGVELYTTAGLFIPHGSEFNNYRIGIMICEGNSDEFVSYNDGPTVHERQLDNKLDNYVKANTFDQEVSNIFSQTLNNNFASPEISQYGDYIISRKKVIFNNNIGTTLTENNYAINIDAEFPFVDGKKYQIEGYVQKNKTSKFCTSINYFNKASGLINEDFCDIIIYYMTANGHEGWFDVNLLIGENRIRITTEDDEFANGTSFYITKIYEIIE